MPDIAATGYHSSVEGTDLHVIMCDLDSKRPARDARTFRRVVQIVADKYRLGIVYIFETRKGFHLMSPTAVSLDEARRIEREFMGWGTDTVHTWLMKKNNGTVLRLTPKPGEGDGPVGPRYAMSIASTRGARPYSAAHVDLVKAFWPTAPLPRGEAIPSATVRLESYRTPDKAITKGESA